MSSTRTATLSLTSPMRFMTSLILWALRRLSTIASGASFSFFANARALATPPTSGDTTTWHKAHAVSRKQRFGLYTHSQRRRHTYFADAGCSAIALLVQHHLILGRHSRLWQLLPHLSIPPSSKQSVYSFQDSNAHVYRITPPQATRIQAQ